jgi:hypothetical protein
MKLFISHATNDKAIVTRISKRLEDSGVSVWRDDAEIRVGDSIPNRIGDALEDADGLCLMYSENAMKSEWVKREFYAFIHRALEGHKLIYPCRLDANTTMPSLIADIKYADFSKSSSESELRKQRLF